MEGKEGRETGKRIFHLLICCPDGSFQELGQAEIRSYFQISHTGVGDKNIRVTIIIFSQTVIRELEKEVGAAGT